MLNEASEFGNVYVFSFLTRAQLQGRTVKQPPDQNL